MYLDENDLYGWAMSQKLPVNVFKWVGIISQFYELHSMKSYDEYNDKNYDKDNDERYIFKVDVEHPKNLHDLHNDLPFLSEKMKI